MDAFTRHRLENHFNSGSIDTSNALEAAANPRAD
jgi:hypothetical protein